MKIFAVAVLGLLLILIGWKVVSFWFQEQSLNAQFSQVQTQLTKAQSEEADLQLETQYLANPENLEKELRARFNYKKPGETMIIIVPGATSSATSSQ